MLQRAVQSLGNQRCPASQAEGNYLLGTASYDPTTITKEFLRYVCCKIAKNLKCVMAQRVGSTVPRQPIRQSLFERPRAFEGFIHRRASKVKATGFVLPSTFANV